MEYGDWIRHNGGVEFEDQPDLIDESSRCEGPVWS